MEIQGKVTAVFPIQTGTSKSGNQWSKQDFIVEYVHSEYPKSIMLTTMDTNITGKLAVGMEVKVQFDFTVREWTSPQGVKKYFNEPRIWKDGLHAISAAPAQQAQQPAPQQQQPANTGESDLPF